MLAFASYIYIFTILLLFFVCNSCNFSNINKGLFIITLTLTPPPQGYPPQQGYAQPQGYPAPPPMYSEQAPPAGAPQGYYPVAPAPVGYGGAPQGNMNAQYIPETNNVGVFIYLGI